MINKRDYRLLSNCRIERENKYTDLSISLLVYYIFCGLLLSLASHYTVSRGSPSSLASYYTVLCGSLSSLASYYTVSRGLLSSLASYYTVSRGSLSSLASQSYNDCGYPSSSTVTLQWLATSAGSLQK